MRQIPPLAAVRVFEAAARHLNFTAAAAELNMTQAAVSYQIRVIEERVGAAFFVRSRRGVALTPLGARAAPLVSSAFELLDDAFAEVREESSTVLSITTLPSFAAGWLAPRIGAFQLAHPEIAVRFDSSNQTVDLVTAGYDAAVRCGAGSWPGTQSRFLARVHFTPMCSPAFAERHALREPADLLRVQRLSSDIEWWPLWMAAAGIDARLLEGRPRISMDTQANESAAAIAGHGVALLTPLLWSRHLKSGELVQPFDTIAYDGQCYWLTVPELRDRTPKLKLFREWLMADIAAAKTDGTAAAFEAPDT